MSENITASDHASGKVDVGQVLDQGHWGGLQKLYVFLVALAVVIDGFDNQVLGLTISSLSAQWGVARDAFATVLALGVVGLSSGTFTGGWLGDRFGRRTMLLVGIILFGVMTAVTATATDMTQLTFFRLFTGLGLGIVMPNATALLTEFTPSRRQVLAITLGVMCVPVGGMLGGYLSAYLIPAFGWQAMYIAGGIGPVIVAAAVMSIMPESPRHLAGIPSAWPRLARLLNRLTETQSYGPTSQFVDGRTVTHAPLRAILSRTYRHDTLALWAAFFTNLLAVYIFFNWMPPMLSLLGLPTSKVGFGSAMYNLGSVVGALACVGLVGKFGMRTIMIYLSLGAVIAGVAFSHFHGETAIIVMLGLMGVFTAGFQILLFSVAAHVYPTQMRSTGVGSALGIGRLGAIVSSFAGAQILHADASGKLFFWFVSAAMALAFISVLQIKSLHAKTEAK